MQQGGELGWCWVGWGGWGGRATISQSGLEPPAHCHWPPTQAPTPTHRTHRTPTLPALTCPQERRTQLFSATMTSKVAKLQRACLRDPVKVEVASKYSTVDTLRQQYMFVPAKYKDCYLTFVLTGG